MIQKLEKISLAFENCDRAEVDASLLRAVVLNTKLTHTAYYDGQINEYQVCSSIMLDFKKDINEIRTMFGEKLTKRLLLFPDIVSITLHDINKPEKVYYAPYKGEEANELQTTTQKDNGSITISIKEKELNA